MFRFRRLLLFAFAGLLREAFHAYKQEQARAQAKLEHADSPADLSKSGWKEALKRTKAALKDKNLSMSAAGLAYYATLSFFPVALGVASLYASLASPQQLGTAIHDLKTVVPSAVYLLIQTMLLPLTTASKGSTVFALVISIVALLWTTSGGLQNLVKATNVAYDVQETRGMIKLRLVSIALSMALLVFGALVLALILAQASALGKLGLPGFIVTVFPFLRWILLAALVTGALAVIYRYAPDRREPHWQWVSWGATAASVIWMIGTALFFVYAQHFANFNKTYGTFAGLVVLMTWFNLSSLIILVGAQVNKKLEEVTDSKTSTV